MSSRCSEKNFQNFEVKRVDLSVQMADLSYALLIVSIPKTSSAINITEFLSHKTDIFKSKENDVWYELRTLRVTYPIKLIVQIGKFFVYIFSPTVTNSTRANNLLLIRDQFKNSRLRYLTKKGTRKRCGVVWWCYSVAVRWCSGDTVVWAVWRGGVVVVVRALRCK